MPDQLMAPAPAPARTREWRAAIVPMVRQALTILVLMAVAGALAGLVWEWLWTPPTGVVVDHRWLQDESGLRGDFAGTGTYVAVAAVVGLLVGVAVALVFDRAELVTLFAVAVGSVLAAWVMYRVGLAVDPPDPSRLAATAEEGARFPGDLRVSGYSPFVAFPSGALVGLAVVFLGLSGRRGLHR